MVLAWQKASGTDNEHLRQAQTRALAAVGSMKQTCTLCSTNALRSRITPAICVADGFLERTEWRQTHLDMFRATNCESPAGCRSLGSSQPRGQIRRPPPLLPQAIFVEPAGKFQTRLSIEMVGQQTECAWPSISNNPGLLNAYRHASSQAFVPCLDGQCMHSCSATDPRL